jgi:hypothetical protein
VSNLTITGGGKFTSTNPPTIFMPPPNTNGSWGILQSDGTNSYYWSNILSPYLGAYSVVGYTNRIVFNSTSPGSNQVFVVPSDVSNLVVKAWGAGGGFTATGYAEGGYAFALIPVTPLESLTLTVGKSTTSSTGGWPNGGNGTAGASGIGYGGGGRTELLRGTNIILTVGGGGGVGTINTTYVLSGSGGSTNGGTGNVSAGGTGGSGGTQTTLATTTGWYNLTTSPVTIFQLNNTTAPYTPEFIRTTATATSTTVLTLVTTWVDDGTSGAGKTANITGGTATTSPSTTITGTAPTTLVTYLPPSTTFLTASWGTPTIAASVV